MLSCPKTPLTASPDPFWFGVTIQPVCSLNALANAFKTFKTDVEPQALIVTPLISLIFAKSLSWIVFQLSAFTTLVVKIPPLEAIADNPSFDLVINATKAFLARAFFALKASSLATT